MTALLHVKLGQGLIVYGYFTYQSPASLEDLGHMPYFNLLITQPSEQLTPTVSTIARIGVICSIS